MAAFDYTDSSLSTPLLRAIFNCKKEEVCRALNQGFSPNLQDNRGWTPIHEAAILSERSDCLKVLINWEPDNINYQTFLGETALLLACENNNIEGAKLLLKKSNCNVNLPTNEGVSPLHVASNNKNLNIVKLLIEFGAKVNSQDLNGYTPLHETVSPGKCFQNCVDEISLEICQHILNHGANLNVLECEGNHPFHLACQNGLKKCLSFVHSVSKQDIVNLKNTDGRTPLMMGVQSKDISVVDTLLSLGANPNFADKSGITALHLAAHSANFEVFNIILNASTSECITEYCTFDEERDIANLENVSISKRINSLICLAIDTEDLLFLNKVLKSNLNPAVFRCPVIHAENVMKKSVTLHTPVSFLLESKMCDLGERTVDFLQTLIDHQSPLNITSQYQLITYINPACACLVALNDCPKDLVIECLKVLLHHGADPDEPYGRITRMSFAMEQACMRGCVEAVMLILQYSNILEPEDVLNWIEHETSSHQERIIEMLIPLAPYYKPSIRLLPHLSTFQMKLALKPKVYNLASYCRHVIRKQLHEETKLIPVLFKTKLCGLELPKDLLVYLSYK